MLKQPLQDKRLLLLKTSNLYSPWASDTTKSTYVANPELCDNIMYSSSRGTLAPEEGLEAAEASPKKKEIAGRSLKPEREGTRGLCQIFKPKSKKKEEVEGKPDSKSSASKVEAEKIPDTEAEAPRLAAKVAAGEPSGISDGKEEGVSLNAELGPSGSPSRGDKAWQSFLNCFLICFFYT
jgi:hypothetical protein